LSWFTAWLQRFVQLGIDLAAALIGGLLRAPATAVARATGSIVVRQATADEVLDVRHQVLRQGRPRDTAVFTGDDVPTTRHWVAVQGPDQADAARVVGVVSVMEAPFPDPWTDGPGPRWQLRGMAVLPGLQGEGVGRRLVEAVHHDVAEPMWCNARERAEGFYLRHGWSPHGDRFDVDPIGPHRRMSWTPS